MISDPVVAAEGNATIYDELDRWAVAIKAAMPGGIPGDLIVCRSPRIIAECKAGQTAESASAAVIDEWLRQMRSAQAA